MTTTKDDIGVNLVIRDSEGKILYTITYLFRDGKIHSSYGDLSEINNQEYTTKMLNILGNIKNQLERQINQLALHLKARRTNAENENLYQ